MISIKRPLLPFGKNRPARLLEGQLKLVRIVAVSCFLLIGAGVSFLYFSQPGSAVSVLLKVAVLLCAALPGILLEFYLGRHKKSDSQLMTASRLETIYSTELLQFAFVLMLGAFLLGL